MRPAVSAVVFSVCQRERWAACSTRGCLLVALPFSIVNHQTVQRQQREIAREYRKEKVVLHDVQRKHQRSIVGYYIDGRIIKKETTRELVSTCLWASRFGLEGLDFLLPVPFHEQRWNKQSIEAKKMKKRREAVMREKKYDSNKRYTCQRQHKCECWLKWDPHSTLCVRKLIFCLGAIDLWWYIEVAW